MRRSIVAGNWKMNMLHSEARHLAHQLLRELEAPLRENEGLGVVLCPPALWLADVGAIIERSPLQLGAQNCHFETSGAFTGAVSAPMLKSAGTQYVIVGHSERRRLFGETDDMVNRKVLAVLQNDMQPIICVGETTAQRNSGKTNQVVLGQVRAALQGAVDTVGGIEAFHKRVPVVAYEPIWAIGSGTPATPADAAEVAQLIRDTIKHEFSESTAERVSILYGGSIKPSNVTEFAARKELDGVLVGGASLKKAAFVEIVKAYNTP